jgi:hypothetical protein
VVDTGGENNSGMICSSSGIYHGVLGIETRELITYKSLNSLQILRLLSEQDLLIPQFPLSPRIPLFSSLHQQLHLMKANRSSISGDVGFFILHLHSSTKAPSSLSSLYSPQFPLFPPVPFISPGPSISPSSHYFLQ